jgi:3-dehydroquinate synthase
MSPDGARATDGTARVAVGLGDRSYEVVVGPGLLARAATLAMPLLRQRRVFIVTDETVARLHLGAVERSFRAADIRVDRVVIPPGEQTKSFAGLEAVVEAMLAARCERQTMIVALGGGVVGDLAGFASAIALRGLEFIQIPTTLLAQVDSSVGGKTGIDTPHGKNLVGAFHQPRLVLADTSTLATLPRRELLAGYAEVLKYGLLGDAAFFAWLQTNASAALGGGARADGPLTEAIVTSCKAKAAIVAADERETSGLRALLNLGHTFAHAFETELGYGDALRHGEAVAIGLVLAFELSARLGLCPNADVAAVKGHLDAVGLSWRPPRLGPNGAITADRLIAHMGSDKKAKDGLPTFVLARGIGRAFLSCDVPRPALTGVLSDALEGAA